MKSSLDTPISSQGALDITQPFVSALVCTRNRGANIISTVQTILANNYPDFELIVVDQSTDGASERAIEPFRSDPRLRHILTPTTGLGLARDIGLREARGEFVCITDDDCDVPVDWLAQQTEAFLRHPRVAVMHCDVLPGPCDYTKGYITATAITTANRLISGFGANQRRAIGVGASMAVRREVALQLGGFDPFLGAGTPLFAGEDTDVGMRALLNGYQVYHLHDVSVIHHGFRTYEQARKLHRGYMLGAGALYGKLIKCGYWQVIPQLLLLYWDMVVPRALDDIRQGQKPRVLGRVIYLTKGVWQAMRTPVDRTRGVFRAPAGSNAL